MKSRNFKTITLICSVICTAAAAIAIFSPLGPGTSDVTEIDNIGPATAVNGGMTIGSVGRDATVTTFNLQIDGNLQTQRDENVRELVGQLETLIEQLIARGDIQLNDDGAAELASGITEIAANAPLAKYVISDSPFTLTSGTTHLLKDGRLTLGLQGFHQSGPMLVLNGKQIRPRAGETVVFDFEGQQCRLIINRIDRREKSGDFTLLCDG